MAYEINLGDDGILCMRLVGAVSKEEVEAVMRETMQFMETASDTEPLPVLSDITRADKLSSTARKNLATMGSDPRMGKNAIVGVSRYQRVMASFVIKASGRDDIRFFDLEEEALAWLKEGV